MILPGATLGLLGGGQLGRMFAVAARTMGYRVMVLDPDRESPAGAVADEHVAAEYDDPRALEHLAADCLALTTEFENPPAECLRWLEARRPVRPAAACVAIAQDRIREKSFLADSGFAVAPFAPVRNVSDLEAGCARVPLPGVLKVSRLGYDGKGQARVDTLAEAKQQFAAWREVPCVLEQWLDLQLEVSVVLARAPDAKVACFPVAENRHQDGILDVSIAPARIAPALALRAQQLAVEVANCLDYCGVLAVEFFVLDGDRLVINELAPRPHNSGHYTLDACLTSQFEQQVRALCDLSLGDPAQLRPAVMVNLLGDIWRATTPDWSLLLKHRNVKLHLYGKREPRPGRKMGHFTVLADQLDDALDLALGLRRTLQRG